MSTKFIQLPTCKLAEFVAQATTEFEVSGFLYNDGVTPVDPADIGDICFATLEPKTAREELISFTINSVTAGGVATITAVRGLSQKSPYGVGGAAFDHQNGSDFVISNNPGLFNRLTAKDNDEEVTGSWQFPEPVHANNPITKEYFEEEVDLLEAEIEDVDEAAVHLTGDETIAGVKTFSSSPIVPAPTADLQVATKKYVDDTAVAGAPNAGETTKGIVEEATDAEVLTGASTGGTGAKLFIPPDKLLNFLRDVVEITTGTTHSLTTSADQRVIVWVKGTLVRNQSTTSETTISVSYNSITKDSVAQRPDNESYDRKSNFALMYTEIPGAATHDIVVSSTAGSLESVVIMVIKI